MDLLTKAKTLFANGDYAEAISLLTTATNDPYSRAAALRLRGRLYYELKEFEKSIADLSEAISTKAPGLHGVRDALRLRAQTAIAMADYKLALDDIQTLLDRSVKGDPDQLEDACDLIDALMKEREEQTALTAAEHDRLSVIVEYLASERFRHGDSGLIWAMEILKVLHRAKSSRRT
jgi:tetratricopeptide (TPR) repeat protein